ncbi:competence type IV pilus minor pilin ComGD [Alkalihalobacillus trypoxylicola]|uniref:Competence protein ComG n=1 Tax=Alkalihalobacillus trypoxylicola TaxID=519424 RepID=A0A161QLJ0_9BACI|nr:competence type IV pilus minor pilin ComGD [Alkalihalobacillus trypoxylicola]KYG30988.1 hypothetical protein AZF04_18500 [Alkalihalobacillus trypoxylicola]
MNKGFTLVETLMVLVIMTILLLIPSILFKSFNPTPSADEVASHFKEVILLTQHVAMTHGHHNHLFIDNRTKKFMIRFSFYDLYLEIPFPREDMAFSFGSLGNQSIGFTRTGNPRNSGTLRLLIDNQVYYFTVHLGKGRVSYEKY